jgi:hypothetical protein
MTDERMAFEEFARGVPWLSPEFGVKDYAWAAWQARAALSAPATGVVEALRELVAIEDDWQQRGFATGRTWREVAAWKAARAALAGQDKGTL